MSAEDVLRWAHEQFGDRMCLTCSWQRQSSALIHMVSELGLDIPIVDWDAKRVQAYIHVNEIPYNPLHDQGYPSIGCVPCTRAVVGGEDERAGRWTGSDKLECGIHINAPLIKESND